MTVGVQLRKKNSGRESYRAWHQDKLIGDKQPFVKLKKVID
jgi:hypothetical protein